MNIKMLMQAHLYFYATWVFYSLNYFVPKEYINIFSDIMQNSFLVVFIKYKKNYHSYK